MKSIKKLIRVIWDNGTEMFGTIPFCIIAGEVAIVLYMSVCWIIKGSL